MATTRRVCFAFVAVLFIQISAAMVSKGWTAEVAQSVLFHVTFLILPPCAYLIALHGRPSEAGHSITPSRAVRLAALAFALTLASAVAHVLALVVLDITVGIPARTPP